MSVGPRVTLLLAFAVLLECAGYAASVGWQPARQLAFSPIGSERLTAPAVYSEGNHVMVVYQKRELWFIESRDGGRTWSEPVSISRGPVLNRSSIASGAGLAGVSRDLRPAIIADRSHLLVAWHSYHQGTYRIFLAKRKRGQTEWDAPAVVVDPGRDNHAFSPRFVLTSQGLYLFWYNVIQPPSAFESAVTEMIGRDTLKVQGAQGPESVNLDVDFRGLGRDTRRNSIGVHFGMLNVSYQVQPDRVRNPSADLGVPGMFEAYTDQFGNLYCAMTENLQVITRKYTPTAKTWTVVYDQRFDTNHFITPRFLGNRLQQVRVENRPGKVVIELLSQPGAAPERVTDPVDISSIPSFWTDGDLTHVVWSRSESDSSWIAYVRSDRTPPTSRFTEPAGREVALINESPFWINWEGSDDFSPPEGLVFRYRFTGGSWSEFKRIEGVRILAPPDRPTPYDVELAAMDEAGNVQPNPAVLKFDVSGVAPETLITQGRQEVVVRRRHQFAWAGRDNTDSPAQLKYSYRLDDQTPSDFKAETSVELAGLREGDHVFEVRAKDSRGNVDPSPAVFPFRVELGIECFFPAPPPIITNQNSYPLAWDCRDETPDVVQFNYVHQLDGGAWSEPIPEPRFTFTNLPEGVHTVAVRAQDEIGNTSRKDLTHTFTVDLTPPKTAPIDQLVLNQNYEPIIQLSAEDNFTPPTRLSYRYSFDNVNWQPIADRELLTLSGRPVRFWSPGYKVYVTSVDEAGNADPEPAVVDYTFLGRDPIAAYSFVSGVGLVALAVLGMMVGRLRPRKKPVVLAEEDLFGEERSAGAEAGPSSVDDDFLGGGSTGQAKKPPDDDLFS